MDIYNPETCFIRRAKNGWILETNHRAYAGAAGPEFVFTTPAKLAEFIQTNFRLTEKQEANSK